uniref:Cilia- and flagella-associated protein 36 n=1 Tax=Haemonchus contortus TaxID=6289 RepID=A0A7I5ED41_HAECO
MLRKLSRKGSSPSTTSSLDPRTVRAKFLDFIDSTIWALPIATFIEQRSVVFDRQQGNVELYEQIHKEFIELVDTLVECFCADTNIPLKSLHDALKSAEPDKLTVRQRTSLEPLAAAKDFNVFVPMMMRKNVELQLQALQMIEFMCGLLPSVLQIEDGETFKNKARVVSPEETERYVLIAVMRQSKEEFDNLSRKEMEELEDVLRSSEEERKRLEIERGKEQELYSRALAATNGVERLNPKKEASNVASAPGVEATTSVEQKKPDSAVLNSDATPSKAVAGPGRTSSKAGGGSETATSATGADSKSSRAATAKKDRRESMPVARTPSATEKERRPSVSEKPPSVKPEIPRSQEARVPPEKTPPRSRGGARPPTAKRANAPSGGTGGGERAVPKSAKERRPSTESRKRKEENNANVGAEKKNEELDEDGVMYGPRGKNIYDVNALLQEPNRLNSAAIRSRAEYLRMQRDRLLAMKTNEREKQLNEVSQRAAQERPRTARAARGLMRGSRGGADDVIAARRAIVDQLKSEIDNPSTS